MDISGIRNQILISECQIKLNKFRVKELKDVLSQLGLLKQGRKQELVDRIVGALSSDIESSSNGSTNIKEVANIIDAVYRKLQGSGASNSVTNEQRGCDVAGKDNFIGSIVNKKICCPCGSSLPTDYMVEQIGDAENSLEFGLNSLLDNILPVQLKILECADANCCVLQHILCVIIPEESSEGIPPAPPQFYCEICRISRADPFWVGVRKVLSPVKVVLSDHKEGTSSTNCLRNLDTEFEITRADQKMLVNSEYDVQVWCMLLNDVVPFRLQWPLYSDLKVNGIPVKTVNRSDSHLLGANGRDDGAIVSLYIVEGLNKISLQGADARSFCVGVRLVKRRTIHQVLNLIPREQEGEPLDDALARVCRCITGGMATAQEDSDSDLEVIADFVTFNLRCPISGSRMKTASRFKLCAHMGCFDLETYVEINQRSRKWQCPICLKNHSLEDLIIDPYFSRITKLIEESGSDITEIEVKSDGSWRAKRGNLLLGLEKWHLPDGSVSNMEGIEGHSTTILDETDCGIKGVRSQNRKMLGCRNQSGEYIENYENNVITMSSSSSESGRSKRAKKTDNHSNEVNSMSCNLGAASGFTNRSSSASVEDPNIVVLSDSEDENACMILH